MSNTEKFKQNKVDSLNPGEFKDERSFRKAKRKMKQKLSKMDRANAKRELRENF